MVRGGAHTDRASNVRSLRAHALVVPRRAGWWRQHRALLWVGSGGATSSERKLCDVTLIPGAARLSRALFAAAAAGRRALTRGPWCYQVFALKVPSACREGAPECDLRG